MTRSTPPGTHGTMSARALNRATLARQMLLQRQDVTVRDAVEHLVGMQAQAPFSPYYGLWARVAGFVADDLARLLVERAVVRIVVMRGTVHLVSADDALGLRPLLQPVLDRALRTDTQHAPGLRGVDLEALAAVARSLLDEAPHTNGELGPLLAARWPDHPPAALAHAARCRLGLVQVPPRAVWGRSGQPRLATVESWLGRGLDPAPSIERMVRRYLAAFGPASVADIQTWSGLTRLREVVDPLRPHLRSFRDEHGKELLDLPDAPRPAADAPAPVRFLPDFDNLLRSHADRTRVVADEHRRRLVTKNGVAPHTVLVDGVVAGTWTITRSRGTATLAVTPFAPLGPTEHDAVSAEAARLLAGAAADAGSHDVHVGAPV